MVQAIQDEECQEPHETIQYMNERQERLMSTMKRKQKLTGEVPRLRQKCQEIGVLDDRVWAEEVELLEKKHAMKELLKERRRTKVEGWRDTVAAEALLRRQQLGLKAPKRELTIPEVSEVGVHWKDTEQVRNVEAPPQRRVVVRKEWAETCHHMSAPPLMSRLDQNMEADDDKNLGEPGLFQLQSASHVGPYGCVTSSAELRISSFSKYCGYCDGRRGRSAHD